MLPDTFWLASPMHRTIGFCKCLSDPLALRICLLLQRSELTIGELQAILELSRSMINERLIKLRSCDAIVCERYGRWLVFRLADSAEDIVAALVAANEEELKWNEQISLDGESLLELLKRRGAREAFTPPAPTIRIA